MTWTWQGYCVGIIEEVARFNEYLTSDDVQAALEIDPRHPNELGAAFEVAKSKGYIAHTDEFIASERPSAKGRQIRVWKSLLYQQPVLFDMDRGQPQGVRNDRDTAATAECSECGAKHRRRDPFGNLLGRCMDCARKEVIG